MSGWILTIRFIFRCQYWGRKRQFSSRKRNISLKNSVTGKVTGTEAINPSTFPIQNVKLSLLRLKRKAVLSDKVFLALHRLYTVR